MFLLAHNTFLELLRNRILYLIFFFGFVFLGLSIFLANLSLWQEAKIIPDVWLAMIELFGVICVLFIGWQMIMNEIEGKTIYLILSKPIYRYEFILGKYFWFSAMLALILSFQAGIFFALLFFQALTIDPLYLLALFFIYLKLLILLALTLLFSTFSSSSLFAIFLTLSIYILWHSVTHILDMAKHPLVNNLILETIGYVTYAVFPPFWTEAMNLKNFVSLPINISLAHVFITLSHALLYLSVILWSTLMIFSWKKFE